VLSRRHAFALTGRVPRQFPEWRRRDRAHCRDTGRGYRTRPGTGSIGPGTPAAQQGPRRHWPLRM